MTDVAINQRFEGTVIQDGLTINYPTGGRLWIYFQFEANGIKNRLVLAIPRGWEKLTLPEIIEQGIYQMEEE